MTAADNIMLFCENVCHVCCRSYDKTDLRFIFSQDALNEKLPEKICKYTPFVVNITSHPTAVICTACSGNMNSWDAYIQSCIETHCSFTENFTGWETEMVKEPSTVITDLPAESSNFCDPLPHSDSLKQTCKTNELVQAINMKFREKSRHTYCIARWCNNNNGESKTSFFRIPKDRQRAEQWLFNAGRPDLLDKDVKFLHSKYLCERHFSENMFMNEKHQRLIWNAVPSIFQNANSSAHLSVNQESTRSLNVPDVVASYSSSQEQIQSDDSLMFF